MGYDGYGVSIVHSNKEIESLNSGPCLIEELVHVEKELSVIVCSRPQGEMVHYPVVESEFHPTANQVEYVLCPARISGEVAKKAVEVALKTAKAYGQIGLLAVELFLTPDGDILVNEVAPRPHNSGHYSIEASYTCQFEQHIRAVLDLPLGKTASKIAAVMVNLVGKKDIQDQWFTKISTRFWPLKELFLIFTEKRKHVLSEKWDMSQSYTPK